MKRMNDTNQRKQQILQTASAEKIGNLCTEALNGNNRTMGKFMNFNWKWVQNIYASLYQMLKKQADHFRLV